MNQISEYIASLVNLYGMVHKDKVVEIYNLQNKDKITGIKNINKAYLKNKGIETYGNYFVHEVIIQDNEYERYLMCQKSKPFYVPEKKKLLNYKDDNYFEETKEYESFLRYTVDNFYNGNKNEAELICMDVQGECRHGCGIEEALENYCFLGVSKISKEKILDVFQLITNLADNTRLWSNNGHTSKELNVKYEPPIYTSTQDIALRQFTKIALGIASRMTWN